MPFSLFFEQWHTNKLIFRKKCVVRDPFWPTWASALLTNYLLALLQPRNLPVNY